MSYNFYLYIFTGYPAKILNQVFFSHPLERTRFLNIILTGVVSYILSDVKTGFPTKSAKLLSEICMLSSLSLTTYYKTNSYYQSKFFIVVDRGRFLYV